MNESEAIVAVTPDIGQGNLSWLRPNADQIVFGGLLVGLLRKLHKDITSSAAASVDYIDSDIRTSLVARFVNLCLADCALTQIWLKGRWQRGMTIITPQDMTAQGLVWLVKMGLPAKIILDCPDAMGKLENFPQKLAPHLYQVWVWNEQARQRFEKKFSQRISVKEPVLLHGFDQKSVSYQVIIKLSGSGGDKEVVREICSSLRGRCHLQSIGLYPGSMSTRRLDQIVALNEKQYRDINLDQMLLIIFPSEQIAYLQQLKDQNIYPQTLCLYPRGRHELDNLIWALKHKLIFSICLPEKLERKLKKKLESAGLDYGRDYMFVAPHRVHMCHFFRQSK